MDEVEQSAEEDMWQIERRLWLDGPSFYAGTMDEACIMAFDRMGVMKAKAVLDSLQLAPRWEDVDMTEKAIGRGGGGVIVLGYRAQAWRDDADRYACYCTSTYRKDGDRWLLIQHQQTPA